MSDRYLAVIILLAFLYIQAYFDIKEKQVYKGVSNIVNVVLWIIYIAVGAEFTDIPGIVTFTVINIAFGCLQKIYSVGDVRVIAAIVPVYALLYTGDELLQRLLFMLLFAEIFLLILKIYDRLKYKISFNEPKEFVPSIMIGTMLIIML